ncbi:unnamed protein product [Paramecium sonneborni]|uniref:Uncharacterized protein n=1 Tax=Paramecium sonneborni TaxID=65129 RepID=A0A8S1Q5L5_9CILI|nr:unnamed protein product [Paramecium sonneborni]
MDFCKQSEQKSIEWNSKCFRYELVPQMKYRQQECCYCIAIDKNNSIVVAGSNNNIKVLQLKDGLKQIQLINKHQNAITTLIVFKNRSYFISGSNDCSIIIWSFNMISNAKYISKLIGHKDWIKCLIVNPKIETTIISGSYDKTIKIWSLSTNFQQQDQQSWVCTQTITSHLNQVEAISINQNGNKLLSCGADSMIFVFQEVDRLWKLKQKIQLKEFGYRISFITDDQFAFQPRNNYLCIYTLNSVTDLYNNQINIQVQGGQKNCDSYFPLICLNDHQMLISKNGININLLKYEFNLTNNIDCKLIQVIEFQYLCQWDGMIYGTASNDGKYLITWDLKSKAIQIRQLKQNHE